MSIYSVNGKEPIAAWIESLDPESVISSKATDLVGANHGTLTNMDLTADPDTARRSDTASGGVRALVSDGVNDRVDFGNNFSFERTESFSVSMWTKFTSTAANVPLLTKLQNSPPFRGWSIEGDAGKVRLYFISTFGSSYIQKYSGASVNSGDWNHIVVTYDGSSSSSGVNFYVNGLLSNGSTMANNLTTTTISSVSMQLFARDAQLNASVRSDDVRIFDQVLDLTDAEYLYANGFGRGIVAAATGKKRPRINGSLINSGLCRSSAL